MKAERRLGCRRREREEWTQDACHEKTRGKGAEDGIKKEGKGVGGDKKEWRRLGSHNKRRVRLHRVTHVSGVSGVQRPCRQSETDPD